MTDNEIQDLINEFNHVDWVIDIRIVNQGRLQTYLKHLRTTLERQIGRQVSQGLWVDLDSILSVQMGYAPYDTLVNLRNNLYFN